MDKILEIKDLRVMFKNGSGENPAVDGISFHVHRGETLCVVGESGCGKSVTSLSVMQLLAVPPGRYAGGEILFEGQDLMQKSKWEMSQIRGKDLAMIFQEPMTALNPVHKIGTQISESLRIHENLGKRRAWDQAVDMLALVGVPDPGRCAASFPHQLSGGMRQRVMIAMAFSCNPKLLIADEPTTALDVTIQAQILDIIKRHKEERGMTVLFITHDLGVVAEIAQRVIVMYSGRIVEEASCHQLFANPLHPYTRGLLSCIPRVDQRQGDLEIIRGQVPNPSHAPTGCRFHPRCPMCMDLCKEKVPSLTATSDGRRVACHLVSEASAPAVQVCDSVSGVCAPAVQVYDSVSGVGRLMNMETEERV